MTKRQVRWLLSGLATVFGAGIGLSIAVILDAPLYSSETWLTVALWAGMAFYLCMPYDGGRRSRG